MDLERAYTPERASEGPRTTALVTHVAQFAIALAILDRSNAPVGRIAVLAVLAGMFGLRAIRRASRAPRGSLSWRDASVAMAATGAYQVGFAWLGATSSAPLGAPDAVGMLLYFFGATLSTVSDAYREVFRSRPGNASRLCTLGPYAVVRYPKYLGDLAWASGWALATRAGAAWLVVGAHAAVLLLVYVPALDRRLAARHRAEWRTWAQRTKRILPLVY